MTKTTRQRLLEKRRARRAKILESYKDNMSELASEDFSILKGPLAQMFKVHVQENGGKLILIPSREIWMDT